MRTWPLPLIIRHRDVGRTALLVVLAACTANILAQTTAPRVVNEDTVWSGQITVGRDVTITGATVRVEPGSEIHFVAAGAVAPGPEIRLRSSSAGPQRPRRQAKLVLAGTADRPIVVESAEGKPRGAITAGATGGCSLVARHTVFRGLGTPTTARQCSPAIRLQLASAENDVWITDCRFSDCGPVQGEFVGFDGTAEISRCTFADTVGPLALVFIGTGTGIKVVAESVADAALRIECPNVLLRDNVLVGESAAIVVPSPTPDHITIASNFVHCTTRRDEGRFALKCDAPDAVVADNVLVGGTYVIETAPRTVTGNVLVGVTGLKATLSVPGLEVKRLESSTMTHHLIANLAAGAVVADNLLLGPAYAALAVGPPAVQPRIQNNLFDGWGVARRAVHFNLPPTKPDSKPIAAVLTDNIITRYLQAPVVDSAGKNDTLAQAGRNLFAEVPEMLYENVPNVPGPIPGDQRLASFAQLQLQAPAATRAAAELEDRLVNRQISVADVRRQWFEAYRPGRDSPLTSADGTHPVGPRSPATRPASE